MTQYGRYKGSAKQQMVDDGTATWSRA